ncbi:MAG: YdeI/OmpD-associated family protein [Cellvibrio sp.]
MSGLHFTSVIKIYNGNPYILVTAEQATTLKKDWRKPMPVCIRINGQPKSPWHINMMPIGDGSFYLYLHGDVRKASKTAVDDEVEVEIKFDSKYKNGPMHPMPDYLREALDKNPSANEGWEKLIPSRQKEILRYFSWLKSTEAQTRNLTQLLYVLSGGKGRYMARDWN